MHTPEGMRIVATALAHPLCRLREIDLSAESDDYYKMGGEPTDPQAIALLAQALTQPTCTVRVLCLHATALDRNAMAALMPALNHLDHLDLRSSIAFGDFKGSLQTICSFVGNGCTLRSLDLSNCHMQADDTPIVAHMLASHSG